MGTSASWNPLGHSRPVTGLIYIYLYEYMILFKLYSFLKKVATT